MVAGLPGPVSAGRTPLAAEPLGSTLIRPRQIATCFLPVSAIQPHSVRRIDTAGVVQPARSTATNSAVVDRALLTKAPCH